MTSTIEISEAACISTEQALEALEKLLLVIPSDTDTVEDSDANECLATFFSRYKNDKGKEAIKLVVSENPNTASFVTENFQYFRKRFNKINCDWGNSGDSGEAWNQSKALLRQISGFFHEGEAPLEVGGTDSLGKSPAQVYFMYNSK